METIKELINKLNVTFFKVKEGEFVIVFGNENNTSYLYTQDITMFIGQTSDSDNIGEKITFDKLSTNAQDFFLELIYFY
jgi:kynureninase